MKCPYCGNIDTRVIDSRAHEENTTIRRRRQCEDCKNRFTTYERVDTLPLSVRKRDGTLEPYDRTKIETGIIRSLTKRPVSIKKVEEVTNEIENIIMTSLEKEIESKRIGELVMDKLKEVDEVAYVRFASVYRQFKDISTFMDELTKLVKEKNTP